MAAQLREGSAFLRHPTSTLTSSMVKTLDEGRQVDVVFLDFAKAFDRVAHDVLLLVYF